jgi:hypothetical protein
MRVIYLQNHKYMIMDSVTCDYCTQFVNLTASQFLLKMDVYKLCFFLYQQNKLDPNDN